MHEKKCEPLVSVIVPAYNIESELPRCLESLLGQSYKNLEILLVDDGSTDGTYKICDEYAQCDKRIHVIHKSNGGQSSARNLALDRMAGEYVTFVDGDDILDSYAITEMLQQCRDNNAQICTTGVRYEPYDGKNYYCEKKPHILTGEQAFAKMLVCDGLDGNVCYSFFESGLIKKLRFAEGKIFECIAVKSNVLLRAEKVARLPKPCYVYVQRSNSSTHQSFSKGRMAAITEAEKLLLFTQKEYPQYIPQAEAMYLLNVSETYIHLARLSRSQRKEFIDCWEIVKRDMREKEVGFLKSSYIALERKMAILSIQLHLYGWIRKIKTGRNNPE